MKRVRNVSLSLPFIQSLSVHLAHCVFCILMGEGNLWNSVPPTRQKHNRQRLAAVLATTSAGIIMANHFRNHVGKSAVHKTLNIMHARVMQHANIVAIWYIVTCTPFVSPCPFWMTTKILLLLLLLYCCWSYCLGNFLSTFISFTIFVHRFAAIRFFCSPLLRLFWCSMVFAAGQWIQCMVKYSK